MAFLLRFWPYLGYPLAAVMFWFWLEAKEDLAAEIQRCNAEKLESIAQASEIARKAAQDAANAQIAELKRQATQLEKARQIAADALLVAQNRPERVRTIIREVANEDACIDSAVHPRLLECMRSDQDCGEARHRGDSQDRMARDSTGFIGRTPAIHHP